MTTIIGILIFVGVMVVMHKFGLGCCGGHRSNSDRKEDNQ